MSSALVVFSGGQDSTTCLGWAKNSFDEVVALSFDYGQKHLIELTQAKLIAQTLGVSHTILPIDTLKVLGDSALLDDDTQVNTHHRTRLNLPASYVPNRNAIFFTYAHAFAIKQGIEDIVIGISQADYSGYPDCRLKFVQALELALNIGSDSNIKFHYPLIYLTKAETFKLAKDKGVLELVIEISHTCYNANRKIKHDWGYGCGACPACELRRKGWQEYLSNFL